MDEKNHRRAITAWTMYDWANSAFVTTVMAAVYPVYYTRVAAAGLDGNLGTVFWAYTTSIAALIAALISPILGAAADFQGMKKKFLSAFIILGVAGTALLFFIQTGDWLVGSLFFIIGNIGFAGSLVFYDSLLPHIARPEEIDRVSSRGYAMGYLGGGLLLAANLAMIMLVPDEMSGLMTRFSFLTVAVWWLIFSIPVLKYVSEPARRILPGEEGLNPVRASISRLHNTFREITRYRDLFLFLVSFWIYGNGIGTIITMATAYGSEIGLNQTTLIGTLLLVQFIGIPFALLFGRLAGKIGAKKSIYLSLLVYTIIAILGYFLIAEWQFWVLGALVATVQGGSQALSRSLFSRMVPKSKTAEFFGFFSVSEKFANIAGPLIFGLVGHIVGHSRLSIVSLVIFFAIGTFILSKVDENRGFESARENT